MADREVDVVVIGGGPVGENAAERTVRGGLSTVLVENQLLGGECSYWACMPSKALLRPGDALAAVRRLPGAQQAVKGTLDAGAVFTRRDSFTSHWDDSSQLDWAKGVGIEVMRGFGRLAGDRLVDVEQPSTTADPEAADRAEAGSDGAGPEQVRLRARHAVIVCTGSVPAEPDLPGLAELPHWGSREATSSSEVPPRLVIVGGGVVGVEMAQAYRWLGSDVRLLAGAGLLARLEPFAGELVADSLRRQGVDVRTGVAVTGVEPAIGGGVRVLTGDGDPVEGDALLIATGRRPATADLGLDTVGLKPGQTLAMDDSGLVHGVDGGWLYAAGDVNGRAPLTHQGKYQARIVGDVVAARAKGELDGEVTPWSAYATTADHFAVPQVIFTDPQVAAVGRTAEQARKAGLDVRVVDLPIEVAGSSLHGDGYTGKARMVVDERRRVLVGVTFVGPDVGELGHSATIAVAGEVPIERLWHAVPSYPTIGEVWLKLLEEYGL